MQRKLIKVGTSAAVIIPKAMLEEQKVQIGDMVDIQMCKKAIHASRKLLDPEVIQWADEFIEEYKPMLKKLTSS